VTASAAAAPGTAASDAAHFDHTDVRSVLVDIVNNGHTIQIDTVGSGVLVVGKDRYVLQQFHFHTPSEHTVDGRSYPLEAHFVHKTAGGKLAVVGLLFEEGAENPALTPYWSRLPKSAGPPVDLGPRRRRHRQGAPSHATRRLSLRGFPHDAARAAKASSGSC
jgi:hypothetical protein